MNKEIKDIINKDLSRIYDMPLSIKDKFLMPLEVKYIILWRKAQYYRHNNRRNVLGKIYNFRLMRLSMRSQIQIPSEVTADAGFFIGHLGRIIIHPDCVLGKNINIATGVTIGKVNRGQHFGVPSLGNNVWIGTNAVIVGNISIGNDVLIAPGAYVNTSIPDHSVVIGNPAVIHPKGNATEGYINRTV